MRQSQKRNHRGQKVLLTKFTWKKTYPVGSPVLRSQDFKVGFCKGLVNPLFNSPET